MAINLEKKRVRERAWRAVNREKTRVYQATYRASHREKSTVLQRVSQYRRRYGITMAQYDAMLVAQGGVCALCGHPPKKRRLNVDHDHANKKVRGLLCFRCNRNHVANHTLETARRVVAYLERHAA